MLFVHIASDNFEVFGGAVDAGPCVCLDDILSLPQVWLGDNNAMVVMQPTAAVAHRKLVAALALMDQELGVPNASTGRESHF